METTMQDSKRLIENQYLRDISKLVVQGKSWGQDCIINPEDQESLVLRELVDFIGSEISKAREEGREESKREYAQAIATGQKVELTEELVDRIWSANLEEMYKMGLTKLLKTKEDEK